MFKSYLWKFTFVNNRKQESQEAVTNIFLYEKTPDGGINNTTKCKNVFLFPSYEYIILFPTS